MSASVRLNDIGAKKNTSDINNQPTFSKEIEHIYNALAGEAGMVNGRDIFLEYGMLEWLDIFNTKLALPSIPSEVLRIKPIADTSTDELVILFANIIGGRNCGTLRP